MQVQLDKIYTVTLTESKKKELLTQLFDIKDDAGGALLELYEALNYTD